MIITGEITSDIQVNDISYHRQAKAFYRNHEMELMLKKLQKDAKKISQPTRDEMMNIFQKSWNETCKKVNNENVFKTNMITIALHGSQDHLASKNLMDLVGTEMLGFRKKLLESKPVSTLKELRLQMIKPEGVRMKGSNNQIPPDEGFELFDGDGDDLDVDYDEELEGEGGENNPENAEIQPSENIENDNVNTKEPTDLVLLRKINDTVNDVKNQCTKSLLPFLTKIESVTANERRKVLKDGTRIVSIIKEALSNTIYSSKVPHEVIQEAEEEEINE